MTQCFKSFISFSTSDVSEMRRLHFFCSSPCLEQFSALIVAWTTAIWGILSPEQLSHLQGITEWSVDMKRTALLEDASGGGGGGGEGEDQRKRDCTQIVFLEWKDLVIVRV